MVNDSAENTLDQGVPLDPELLNSLDDEEIQMFDTSKLNQNESLSLSKSLAINEMLQVQKSRSRVSDLQADSMDKREDEQNDKGESSVTKKPM